MLKPEVQPTNFTASLCILESQPALITAGCAVFPSISTSSNVSFVTIFNSVRTGVVSYPIKNAFGSVNVPPCILSVKTNPPFSVVIFTLFVVFKSVRDWSNGFILALKPGADVFGTKSINSIVCGISSTLVDSCNF